MHQGFKRSRFWVDLTLKNCPVTIVGQLENTHTQEMRRNPHRN